MSVCGYIHARTLHSKITTPRPTQLLHWSLQQWAYHLWTPSKGTTARHSGLHYDVHLAVNPIEVIVIIIVVVIIIIIIIIIFISLLILFITPVLHIMSFVELLTWWKGHRFAGRHGSWPNVFSIGHLKFSQRPKIAQQQINKPWTMDCHCWW